MLGPKLHFFVKLLHYRLEQQVKCGRLNWLNTIFLRFDWFNIFDALTFILQDKFTLFSLSMYSHSCNNFYFEVTLFVVETIIFKNAVSQVVVCYTGMINFIARYQYNNWLLLLMESLFYRLYIVVHKLNCFAKSFHNHRKQRVKYSCLIWLNTIFLWFD